MWHRMKMRNNANKRSLTGAKLCLVLQEPFSSHDSYNQLKAEDKLKTIYVTQCELYKLFKNNFSFLGLLLSVLSSDPEFLIKHNFTFYSPIQQTFIFSLNTFCFQGSIHWRNMKNQNVSIVQLLKIKNDII